MAHQIERNGDRASFVQTGGRDAWHRLGTTLPEGEILTAGRAFELAALAAWDVRKAPMVATLPLPEDYTPAAGDAAECVFENGLWVPRKRTLDVADNFATVRDNPYEAGRVDQLGVVGNQYDPFQNEESADLLDAITAESGAHIETAGSLREGKETFVTMRLPETMLVGGADGVDLYLSALNTHDGTKPFRFIVSPVRIVCANTQAAALRAARSTFAIKHLKGGRAKIEEARQTLGLTFEFVEAFQAEADAMIDAVLTAREFDRIVTELFPAPKTDSKRSETTHSAKIDALHSIYQSDPTQADLKGTKWGGYQAVTRYLDHQMPVTGQKTHDAEWAAVKRAERTLTAHGVHKLKESAFAAFAPC